jgi:hypothetical protein
MGAKFFPPNTPLLRLGGRREIKHPPVVIVPPAPPVSGWSSFRSGENSYTDYVDTYIREGLNEGINYETATTVIIDANASDERFGLLKWGGAGLSAAFNDNTTLRVTSASIDFEITAEGEGFILNELLTDYDFTTITWTNSTPVSGTDIALSAFGIWAGDIGQTGPYNITVDIATVERWIRYPESVLGLWAYAAGSDPQNGQQIASDDNATVTFRPKLNIAWEEPASAAP